MEMWDEAVSVPVLLSGVVIIRKLVSLHLLFYTMRQLFDLFSFFEYVEGESVFVGFVDILLQFVGQFDEVIGIALELGLAIAVSFFRHIFFDFGALLFGVVILIVGVSAKVRKLAGTLGGVLTERW